MKDDKKTFSFLTIGYGGWGGEAARKKLGSMWSEADVKQYLRDKKIKFTEDDMKDDKEIVEFNIKQDKQLRSDLDDCLQDLKGIEASRERSLAITKLQEAIMWLGMDLKRLGSSNPYPDSYNADNANVAPTSEGLKL